MLHRSFKPAKCKTALKLAVSRIKLLKNKRASHMAQLRREVAQLLDSGQERTARIRVEHVIREEKTMAAYDLLEVYCELIAARLAMIESQKNCPIDLKEAVTSVIFASPRCADLPELQDVRKNFQSKYGKEFTTAALELRPGCGVSRLMIEKLSAGAPDLQTKINILSAIALEHNIKWDPNTSGENEENPSEDLLNGPNSFLRASQKYEEPPVQTPKNDTQKYDAIFSQNPSSSPISQNFDKTGTSSTSPLGTPNARAGGMEHRYTYSGDQNTFAAGKKNWNMKFTDATCAAQAAAEAAEQASMAARAAVELSSGERMARQNSSGSQRPPVNDLRNGSANKHSGSTNSNANVSQVPADKFEHGGDPRMRTDNFSMKQTRLSQARPDADNHNDGLGTHSSQSQMKPDPAHGNRRQGTYSELDSSLGSNLSSTHSKTNSHDSLSVQGIHMNEQGNHTKVNEELNRHGHVRGSSLSDSLKSSASFHENVMSPKSSSQEDVYSYSEQAAKIENNFVGEARSEMQNSNIMSTEAEDINYFADQILHKQPTDSDSPNHSVKFDDEHDDLLLDKLDDVEHDTFHPPSTETVVFDNSGSDDDGDYKYDNTGGFKDEYPDPFGSPDRKLPIYESPKRRSMFASDTSRVSYDEFDSKSIFLDTESSSTAFSSDKSKLVGSSQSHESIPVAFDQSDSEAELDVSDMGRLSSHKTSSRHTGFDKEFIHEESVAPLTKFDEDESLQDMYSSRHSFNNEEESKPKRKPSFARRDEQGIEHPGIHGGKELNLGMLSGGFRNKGKKHPFYIKSPSDDVPSRPSNDSLLFAETRTSADFESSGRQGPGGSNERRKWDKMLSPRFKATHYSSEEDSGSDELPQTSIGRNKEKHSLKTSSLVTDKPSFNSRPTYSVNYDLQTEEATTVQVSRPKPRTDSPSVASQKSSFSSRPTYSDNDNLQIEEEKTEEVSRPKPRLGSGLSKRTKNSAPDGQRKPSRETYGSASSSVMDAQTTNREDQYEEPKLTKPIPRKSVPEVKKRPYKLSSSEEQLQYSSNVPPTPSPTIASSSNPKSAQAPTRQDSSKKASHVHPKLPDFDTLAAHFSSLRTDGK